MGKAKRAKAAETGEFLFRYMVARYRCVGGSLSSGRIRLVAEIKRGIQVFEGAIIVDAEARPPLINDREHYVFFAAMIGRYDGGLPEIAPAELAQWRNYVFNHGPQPKRREPFAVGSPVSPTGLEERKHAIFGQVSDFSKWLLGRFPFAILAGSRKG